MRRALVLTALVTAIVLLAAPGCSSDGDDDSSGGADTSATDGSAEGGGGDDGDGDDGALTADVLCDAVDEEVVAEAIAPVREVTVVDESVCNVGLDLPGLGSMLSLSIEGNPLGVGDGDQFFDDVVAGYETIYETEAEPVDGLGDGAFSFAIDAGDAVVVRIGDEVVLFSPLLSDDEVTVDQWQPVIESVLSGLG